MSQVQQDPAEIRVRYEQNFDDFCETLTEIGMISRTPSLPFYLGAMIGAVLSVIAWNEHVNLLASVLTAITLILLLGAAYAKKLVTSRLRANWKRSRIPGLSIEIRFTDAHVVITTDLTHTQMQWPAFLDFGATDRLIILIIGTGNILAIPVVSLGANDAARLYDLLTRKVKRPGSSQAIGFPVMQKERENNA